MTKKPRGYRMRSIYSSSWIEQTLKELRQSVCSPIHTFVIYVIFGFIRIRINMFRNRKQTCFVISKWQFTAFVIIPKEGLQQSWKGLKLKSRRSKKYNSGPSYKKGNILWCSEKIGNWMIRYWMLTFCFIDRCCLVVWKVVVER